MEDEIDYEKYEQEFQKLDKKEYTFLGKQLGLFKTSMVDAGFLEKEAMKLTLFYTQFIFNMGVEEFVRERIEQWEEWAWAEEDEDEEDDDVAPEDDLE